MRRLKWAVLFACLPAVAGAGEWWQGKWAWDKSWCAREGQIGRATPAPIAITPTEVLGYENSCIILRAHPLRGMAAVRLRLECRSEGEIYDESRLIMRDGREAIWIWFGEGEPMKFHLCPEPVRPPAPELAPPVDDWWNKK